MKYFSCHKIFFMSRNVFMSWNIFMSWNNFQQVDEKFVKSLSCDMTKSCSKVVQKHDKKSCQKSCHFWGGPDPQNWSKSCRNALERYFPVTSLGRAQKSIDMTRLAIVNGRIPEQKIEKNTKKTRFWPPWVIPLLCTSKVQNPKIQMAFPVAFLWFFRTPSERIERILRGPGREKNRRFCTRSRNRFFDQFLINFWSIFDQIFDHFFIELKKSLSKMKKLSTKMKKLSNVSSTSWWCCWKLLQTLQHHRDDDVEVVVDSDLLCKLA